MMDRAALAALIKSKARVDGHSAWEGGYYYLSNAEEIADAIIRATPPPLPAQCHHGLCSDCVKCGCKK